MTQFQIILVHTMNPPWDNFGCQTKLSTIATIVRQNLQLSNANIIVGYVVRFFVQNAVVFSYLEDISMSLVLSEFVTPVTKILKKILPKCCQVFFFYSLPHHLKIKNWRSLLHLKIWTYLDKFFFHSFQGGTKGKMLKNQCIVMAIFQHFSFGPPLETMKKKVV